MVRKKQDAFGVGVLAAIFFVIALCYASAGFGGGSSYTAVLLAAGEPPEVIRMVSLTCNLFVAGMGGWMSIRAGWSRKDLLFPLLITSIPGTWLGALQKLSGTTYVTILSSALFVAGILLIGNFRGNKMVSKPPVVALIVIGFSLGILAGITGIGGGIYLVPLLHLKRAGRTKEVAAVGTWFIMVNSLVGLATLLDQNGVEPLTSYGMLPLVVLVGGLMGGKLLHQVFDAAITRRVTGCLILVVSVLVFLR